MQKPMSLRFFVLRAAPVLCAAFCVACGDVPNSGVGDGGRAGQSGSGGRGASGGSVGSGGAVGAGGSTGVGGMGDGMGGMPGAGGDGAGGSAGASGLGGRPGSGGSTGMGGSGAGGSAGAGAGGRAGAGGGAAGAGGSTADSGVRPDAGVPDAGMAALTCVSNQTFPDANRYVGGSNMNPGLACRACHTGSNFMGQNPQNASAPNGDRFYFAGTVYPSRNERDFCRAMPPGNTVIEIVGRDGGVQLSMNAQATSGNFYSAGLTTAPAYLPYTARVRRAGQVVATMQSPQMSGDCNSCHTERGAQGAPGRVTWQ
jgi:hypothetical protein